MVVTQDLARLGTQAQGRQIREILGVHADMKELSRRQRLPEHHTGVGVDVVDELTLILLIEQIDSYRIGQHRLQRTGVVLHGVAVEVLERIGDLNLVQLTEQNRVHPTKAGETCPVAVEPEREQLAVGKVVGHKAVDAVVL